MNNIFDDKNNRSDAQSTANSGSESGFNSAQNSGVTFTPPPQNSQQNVQMPQLQLTPEQIAALLNQLIIVQQPPLPQAQVQNPAAKTTDTNALDPGKRILYQSADFYEPDDKKDENENLLPAAVEEESRKKSFYDDDDLFNSESASRLGLHSVNKASACAVRTTDFGGDFSVAEVELAEDELPKIQNNRIVTDKRRAPLLQQTVNTEEIEEETLSLPPRKASQKSVPLSYPQKNTLSVPASKTAPDTFVEEEIEHEEKDAKEKKKPSTSEIIRRCVLIISLLAIVISCAVLMREYKLHKDNERLEAEISDLILPEEETTQDTTDVYEEVPDPEDETTQALSEDQQWLQIKAQYPNVIFPPNLQLKYAKLYATNQDFVGYLSADGVNLNLPVVQTTDDEKYLNKNFYGKSTKYGCPFVTHLNNIEPLDMNTVIFGHHMNDGTVFGALDKYKTIDGFKKAPVITFNTLYNDYQWKVIAAFITNAYEKDDNGYVFQYYFTSLSTTERFSAFLNELAQRSLYDTGVDVLETDKLLTLSTCSHEFDDARFVVVARLVRPGESAEVNTDNAVVNSSPRYPQAYYDKKKLTNPYKDAQKWYVG